MGRSSKGALLAVLLAAPVDALGVPGDDEPVIAVLDVAGSDMALQEAVREILVDSLRRYRVHLEEGHEAVLAAHAHQREAAAAEALSRARASFQAGRRLFDAQDAAGAERELRKATDLFEANAGWLTSSQDLVQSYVVLAQIFFATNRQPAVREVFRRVVQLAPEHVLDRAVHPPDFIGLHEEARRMVVSGPLASMKLESEPSPARVFLDGSPRGVTPLEIVNVPPGLHVVTFERSGFERSLRSIDVVSYRADTHRVVLDPAPHPQLSLAFAAGGATAKDALGLSVTDWLDEIARRAKLDLAIVGEVKRQQGDTFVVSARSFRRDRHYGTTVTRTFRGRPANLDAVIAEVLKDAASRSWIPAVAARRNVEAGGGALDKSAPLAMRAGGASLVRMGTSRSFPRTPIMSARVGADYRIGMRDVVSGATGIDFTTESGVRLRDGSGDALPGNSNGVTAIYTALPIEGGARHYFGVRTWAPYAAGGAEIRIDTMLWRERLPHDRISSNPGIGVGLFAGGGVERALDSSTAVYLDGRLQLGTMGVRSATVSTDHYPSRRASVAAPMNGVRLQAGWMKVF